MPFCSKCGTEVPENINFCQKCGHGLQNTQAGSPSASNAGTNGKDWTTLLLLSIFLGWLGADHFYADKTKTGIFKLLVTLVSLGTLCWIWWIIDIILILQEKFKDDKGNIIRK